MIKKCCVCQKVKEDGGWQKEKYSNAKKQISHVYCPPCFRKTMNRINRLGGLGRINLPDHADLAQAI